jgi:lipid-A-disaccharide synthase-like uncharacterized protein
MALVLLALLLAGSQVLATPVQPAAPTDAARVATRSLDLRIKPLPPGVRRVTLQSDRAGAHWFLVQRDDGSVSTLTPDELAALLEPPTDGRRLLFGLLNITSLAGVLWVVMGLLGQALFSGRMILQWIVSERSRRSVVPVGFWWMSLAGASMLLVYFVWRRDIVGVLGQSTGWIIYTRNLWLIYRERRQLQGAGPA